MPKSRIVQPDTPYTYSLLCKDLEQLKVLYPFIEMTSIGSSVMGKELHSIKIGNGKRRVHYNGAFHANEWITSLLLMSFIEDYARQLSDQIEKAALNERVSENRAVEGYQLNSLYIVPMVNPDGVDLVINGLGREHLYQELLLPMNSGFQDFSGWKANILGVDLNDQFPAHWEREKQRRAVQDNGPRDYPGEGPLTEPEAIAMENYTRQNGFDMVIAFHTQGEEIYWNYEGLEPAESQELVRRFAAASGYLPVKLTDSDAGYKDWFIQEFRRPGFTVEAGLGVNPLSLDPFDRIYKQVSSIMWEGLVDI